MKITDRGYWVSKIFYFQSLIYYLVYAIKFKSLTFFSACNPNISLGGMLDEKKTDIYQLLPEYSIPTTIIATGYSEDLESRIVNSGLVYPVILKPNIGFKGHMVAKINTSKELINYLKYSGGREVLIQEFIQHDREFSLLYYRFPISGKYGISSLVEKKYPFVKGDGISTLDELISQDKNPFVAKDWAKSALKEKLSSIPELNEIIIIDSVGNYSRGAKFYNLATSIDNNLVEAANNYFKTIKGFDFCRVDFKSNDLAGFVNKEFKVMEINGAKSEPLHIYHPGMSFRKIFKNVHQHWSILVKIVEERKKLSFRFPSAMHGIRSFNAIKKLMKQ